MPQAIDLGFAPRDWQAATYRLLKRFSVLVVHRRGGKTVQAVMKLIDAALECERERGHFGYIAPQRNQAKGVAWDYVKHYALKVPGATVNEAELWVRFPNGAKVRLFGADDPNSLRGYYFDGVVVDEVAQMKREIWGEILIPALSDRSGWALFIGTPQGENLLSELYVYAQQREHEADWFARSYPVDQTGVFTPAEIAELRLQMSDGQFRQEYMCDFSASSDNVLVTLDMVQAATRRLYGEPDYMYSQKRLGVDVARFGSDKTVIYCRQGLKAGPFIVLEKLDTQQIADRVALAVIRTNAEMVFVDQTGVGAGVVDALRRLRVRTIGVDSSSEPTDARYFNKRAEMMYGLADWIKAGGWLPDDPILRQELTAAQYGFKNGKVLIEPKDKIKERIGRSPDRADALALTFAAIDRPGVPEGSPSPGFLQPYSGPANPGDFDPLRTLSGKDDNVTDFDPLGRKL